MWAAYRRGSLEDIKQGLSAEEFKIAAFKYINAVRYEIDGVRQGDLWAVVMDIPIGVVGVHFDGNVAFPHVSWFPEASPRNKVEAGVMFIDQLKKEYLVLITGPEGNAPYWRHLAKYGLLRGVGKIRDFYGKGEGAMMFQSVSKK